MPSSGRRGAAITWCTRGSIVNRAVGRMSTTLLRLRSAAFGLQRFFQRHDSSNEIFRFTPVRVARGVGNGSIVDAITQLTASEVAHRA